MIESYFETKLGELYHCDNLDLMKQLPSNFIDLIYCDVLYGTGRNFGDYQDIKAKKEIVDKFYIPRIKEMHRTLKETGSIYLQTDTKINHWIRLIMDEVLGYDNFRNEIIWCYTVIQKLSNKYPSKHDVLLFYTKTNNYIFNNIFIPYLKSNKNNGMRSKKITDWNKFSYLLDKRGKQVEDYWLDIPMLNSMAYERTGYQTQKPKALLERIIKASSNEGDLVADFFCGSGTTLVVAKELNRKFIGCDIEGKAVKVSKERLKQQGLLY